MNLPELSSRTNGLVRVIDEPPRQFDSLPKLVIPRARVVELISPHVILEPQEGIRDYFKLNDYSAAEVSGNPNNPTLLRVVVICMLIECQLVNKGTSNIQPESTFSDILCVSRTWYNTRQHVIRRFLDTENDLFYPRIRKETVVISPHDIVIKLDKWKEACDTYYAMYNL